MLGTGVNCDDTRPAGAGLRLACFPLEDQRGLFLHHDPALTYAGMLLFFRNETGFGGNNGFTGFTTLLGFSVTATTTRIALFLATVMLLLLAWAQATRWRRVNWPHFNGGARCGKPSDVLRL